MLTDAEMDTEIERLITREYDHPACDQECQYNAKGIALLGRLRYLRERDANPAEEIFDLREERDSLKAENAKVLNENERLRRQFVPLSLRTGGLAEAVAFMGQSSATIAAIHERERALEAEVAKLRAALADYYNQAATIWLLAQTVQQVTGQPLFTAGNNAAEGLR